ncbi:DUF1570 domain-containing protein [Parerythrobacter aurantius]|uniref:DUF1570 domain-containing protein n=1 Tax=Parerythrobacter aurantius TaxID=3127706 RepID=UPI003250066A
MLGIASPASAKWRVAESDHFVIYAEDSEKDLQRFALALERYHAAMSYVVGRKVSPPSPSNRVTIFVVGDQGDIRRLKGDNDRFVGAFYSPRAGGSVAFVQDIQFTSGEPTWSMILLLHEYAHHFIMTSSRFALPRWMNEGAAEFFASAKFGSDGTVQIGRPANHRAGELAYADDVTVQELLDPDLYEAKRGRGYDAFYGKSWLLYHYLRFNEERRGQIGTYMQKLATGSPSAEAAQEAFGDIDQLNREVKAYLKSRKMSAYNVTPDLLTVGAVTISELSTGAEAMMPVVVRSRRGVDAEGAAEVVVEARRIAAAYPEDAFVLTALAEAEYDAGNDEAAIAAADAAITRDRGAKNAYVQKGYALFRLAADAEDKDAAYKAAMAPFTTLNSLENDHPLPLIYYYRSYAERGQTPPEQAKLALEQAAMMAPFDKGLWINAGMMQAQEGQIALAISSLTSVANDPHGGKASAAAKSLIAQLEKATEGQPFRFGNARGVANALEDEEGDEGE